MEIAELAIRMKPRTFEELRRIGVSVERLKRTLDAFEMLAGIYDEFGIAALWLERRERLMIEIETLRHHAMSQS
jgi:hypothetical protein